MSLELEGKKAPQDAAADAKGEAAQVSPLGWD
jgi:hypothetical protein